MNYFTILPEELIKEISDNLHHADQLSLQFINSDFSRLIKIPFNINFMDYYSKNDYLDLFELYFNFISKPVFENQLLYSYIILNFIRNKNLAALKFLDNKFSIKLKPYAYDIFELKDNLKIIEYVFSKKSEIYSENARIFNIAVRCNNFEAIKFLFNCKYNYYNKTLMHLVEHHKDIFIYLVKNKLNISSSLKKSIAEYSLKTGEFEIHIMVKNHNLIKKRR